MKKIILFIMLVFFEAVVYGQNKFKIDSLEKLLPYQKNSERFSTLNRIAWEYRLVNQDSSIAIAQRAYDLGKKLDFKHNLAKPLNYLGVAHEYKGETFEAYDFYRQALQTASQQNDQNEVAYAYNNSGRLFLDHGNTNRSLENFHSALKIFEELHDSSGIAYVYASLSKAYELEKKYDLAENYLYKTYNIRVKIMGGPNIPTLLRLGVFYRETGNLKKSNATFLKADSLCKIKKDEIYQAETNLELADNFLLQNKWSSAYQRAKNGFLLASRNNITRELTRSQLLVGKSLYNMDDQIGAKAYFDKVVDAKISSSNINYKMEAHYYLGQIYASKAGEHLNQLKNHNEYLKIKDSLKEVDLARQIEKLKFQFQLEIEQKQKENELLKTIDLKNNSLIKKQQLINLVYGVTLIVIIVIAIVQYRTVRLKQRLNNELAEKQQKILKQTEELTLKNAEIERVNSNLEQLVNERTNTIQQQHERLIEYSYFNAHQIRGPLARILGLISVINIEYKDSYGSYLEMLNQAGNDLDTAIKKVNDLLNED
jgi:tetratricopeptide (TPR) repeat protein